MLCCASPPNRCVSKLDGPCPTVHQLGPGGFYPAADCAGPILSVFPARIVHSELKSVHPGFPVAFIF